MEAAAAQPTAGNLGGLEAPNPLSATIDPEAARAGEEFLEQIKELMASLVEQSRAAQINAERYKRMQEALQTVVRSSPLERRAEQLERERDEALRRAQEAERKLAHLQGTSNKDEEAGPAHLKAGAPGVGAVQREGAAANGRPASSRQTQEGGPWANADKNARIASLEAEVWSLKQRLARSALAGPGGGIADRGAAVDYIIGQLTEEEEEGGSGWGAAAAKVAAGDGTKGSGRAAASAAATAAAADGARGGRQRASPSSAQRVLRPPKRSRVAEEALLPADSTSTYSGSQDQSQQQQQQRRQRKRTESPPQVIPAVRTTPSRDPRRAAAAQADSGEHAAAAAAGGGAKPAPPAAAVGVAVIPVAPPPAPAAAAGGKDAAAAVAKKGAIAKLHQRLQQQQREKQKEEKEEKGRGKAVQQQPSGEVPEEAQREEEEGGQGGGKEALPSEGSEEGDEVEVVGQEEKEEDEVVVVGEVRRPGSGPSSVAAAGPLPMVGVVPREEIMLADGRRVHVGKWKVADIRPGNVVCMLAVEDDYSLRVPGLWDRSHKKKKPKKLLVWLCLVKHINVSKRELTGAWYWNDEKQLGRRLRKPFILPDILDVKLDSDILCLFPGPDEGGEGGAFTFSEGMLAEVEGALVERGFAQE